MATSPILPTPPAVAACQKDLWKAVATICAVIGCITAVIGFVVTFVILPSLAQRDDVRDLKQNAILVKSELDNTTKERAVYDAHIEHILTYHGEGIRKIERRQAAFQAQYEKDHGQ